MPEENTEENIEDEDDKRATDIETALYDDDDKSPYVRKETFAYVVTNLSGAIASLSTAVAALEKQLKKLSVPPSVTCRIRIAGEIEVFVRGDKRSWVTKSAQKQAKELIEMLGLKSVAKAINLNDPSVG